jgi:hypothetical protein
MDGIQSTYQGASLALDYSSQKLLERRSQGDEGQVQKAAYAESMAFNLDLSHSLQVAEGETRRSLSSAYSMEFSFSMESLMQGDMDSDALMNPEDTANRILDFVGTAFDEARKFADGFSGGSEDLAKFLELSEDAVYEGFANARDLLGNLDPETESNLTETLDLVVGGLGELFDIPKESEELPEPTAKPGEGLYYSSQSFSLSYQVAMQSNGLFEPGELQDFISESLSRIQEFFNGLLKPEALEDKEKEAAEDEENAELVAQPTQLFQMEEPQAQKVRELLIG